MLKSPCPKWKEKAQSTKKETNGFRNRLNRTADGSASLYLYIGEQGRTGVSGSREGAIREGNLKISKKFFRGSGTKDGKTPS